MRLPFGLLHRFTYLGILLVLLSGGLGAPVSEDLTLLAAGYLARRGITEMLPTMLVAFVGVVIGDLLVFRVGRALGERLFTHRRFARLLTPARRARLEHHFQRRGVLTVVVARHVGGLRMPAFLVAGSCGMKLWKFVLADAGAALVTVPLLTVLGYAFADKLPAMREALHHGHVWVLSVLAAMTAVWIAARARRAARRPAVEEQAAA